MQLETNSSDLDLLAIPPTWDRRLARWVSNLLTPALVGVAGAIMVSASIGTRTAWLWMMCYLIIVSATPVTYVLWKVHQGKITDYHMVVRRQRYIPLTITLVFALIGLAFLWIGGAPQTLVILAVIGVFQAAFMLLVTFRWKISGHGIAVASFTIFACMLYGRPAWPSLLAIPLVCWARVRLNRHDLLQTLGGVAGGVFFMLLLYLYISHNCGSFELTCR